MSYNVLRLNLMFCPLFLNFFHLLIYYILAVFVDELAGFESYMFVSCYDFFVHMYV